MLRVLRKKGVAKKILWVLAVMITISFVFWGVASYLTQGQGPMSCAGKIFGRDVSFREFESSFQHVQNQAILRYGDNFQKIRNYLNLNSEAWDRLILLHEGKKRHIRVSNDEVIKAIKKFSFFQRNGKFDKQLYAQIVQYAFQCAPSDFEDGIRESLIFEKIYKQETLAIDVTDDDARKEYDAENAKAQVDYVFFPIMQYQDEIVIADETLNAYYKNNQDLFRLPAGINIEFIALEYPTDATEEAKKTLDQTANQISQTLASRKIDLAQIAQEYHLSVKESGFFSIDDPKLDLGWPLEIFQKALNLKKDEVAGPIATAKGFYLLKLKDTQEARLLTFDEARNKAQELLALQEAKKIAEQKAKEALDRIKTAWQATPNEKFEILAKKLDLKIEKTPEFTRAQYLPGIGPSAQFQQTAFTLTKENPLSSIVEMSSGYAIIYLTNFIPADNEKFLKDKDFLKERLLTQRRDQAFNAFLAKLRQQANLVDNIKKLEEAQQAP